MLKQSFRTFTVAVLLVLATGLAYAQADVSKVEVGVQFNLTRLRDLSETDTGMGGRVVYNFNKMISAEAEFNYFPGDLKDFSRFFGTNEAYSSSRKQGLFGVKYGLRGDKFGIFGKLRPGFTTFSGSSVTPSYCVGVLATSTSCQIAAGGTTKFTTDIGGVLEYYPQKKTVFRFDIGDTIIPFGPSFEAPDGFTSHNLTISVGVGFRF